MFLDGELYGLASEPDGDDDWDRLTWVWMWFMGCFFKVVALYGQPFLFHRWGEPGLRCLTLSMSFLREKSFTLRIMAVDRLRLTGMKVFPGLLRVYFTRRLQGFCSLLSLIRHGLHWGLREMIRRGEADFFWLRFTGELKRDETASYYILAVKAHISSLSVKDI